MKTKRILLLYISEDSGHHCASIAIEKALHQLDPAVETLNINSFNYTNPILEKIINKTYMSVIKRKPELWDYLYDNPDIVKKTQRLREMIHKFNNSKLDDLLNDFKPSSIVCTQAFPCGMIADYKKTFNVGIPLIGVLTDYAPHSYWMFDNVDRYIVPCDETGKKLVFNGIDPHKIDTFGIPLEHKFAARVENEAIFRKLSLDPDIPCILIMGGTQGLGPIKDLVRAIDRAPINIQMIVTAGTNKKLYRWLRRAAPRLRKKAVVFQFASNVEELMQISTLIVTKPGGITTAEALAKGLPMLIVQPLPGQEAMNTKYLLREGVAVKAESPVDAVVILQELLYNRDKLAMMRNKAKTLAKPHSSVDIARRVLEFSKR